ncbi:MAG: hypothetical protein ACRDCD_02050 [Mycoplasmoidaceae bacterium]
MSENKKQLYILASSSKANSEIKNKIIYSKYNKFIFKTNNNNSFSKKQNLIYKFCKFGLVAIIALFIIISLLTLILQNTTLNYYNVNMISMNVALGNPISDQHIIEEINGALIFHFLEGLGINVWIIYSIIAIGIVLLFLLISILFFKNGTLLSVISLSLGFVLLLTIIWLLSIVIFIQGGFVMTASEGTYLSLLDFRIENETERLENIFFWIIDTAYK